MQSQLAALSTTQHLIWPLLWPLLSKSNIHFSAKELYHLLGGCKRKPVASSRKMLRR